jgi:sucrose synthase
LCFGGCSRCVVAGFSGREHTHTPPPTHNNKTNKNTHNKNNTSKAPYSAFEARLVDLGFERGWGADAAGAREAFRLLLDILQAPDAETLERFLGRLPVVMNVAIVSPHGYFGQSNVLGLPDTGGQVN